MSDRTLQATITAIDKASPVFKQVADGSQKMGTAIEQSASRSSRALTAMGRAQNDLAIGAAALGASFTLAARAAQDQERQIDAINRLYGESADEILALSEAIQDNTNFSNDAARQAAITGSTLAQNYQLTADQIGVLIERSANLAQVHGIDLADAMTRVSGAIRGEGEAAELLGLNMSDSAVAAAAAAAGIRNWNSGLSEAEKAAFRYSLVLEQTNATLGAAEQAAQGTRGTVIDLRDSVQDAAANFANWTGPIGEATAALSDNALEIGLAVGGMAKLGQGIGELVGKQRLLAAGTSALNLAMGPAGLVAAAGLAAIAVVKVIDAFDDANLSAKEASDEIATFEETLARLGKQGTGSEALGNLAQFRDVLERIVLDSESAETRLQGALSAATQRATEELEAQATGDAAALDAAHARTKAAEDYVKVIEETIIDQGQLNELSEDIIDIFTDMNPLNADLVIARVEELTQRWRDGKLSADDYIDAIDDLNEHSDSYGLTIDEIAAGSRRAASAGQVHALSIEAQTAALERINGVIDKTSGRWEEYDQKVRDARVADAEKAKANKELLDSMSVQANAEADQLDRNTRKWTEYDDKVREHYDSRVQSTKAAQASLDALAEERAALEAGAVAGDSFASATEGVGDAQNDVTDAIASGTVALRENETAMDRLARGSTSAGVALRAFKDIQDGIISDQGQFTGQLSEYGQQLDYLQNAEDLLNQRRAEGVQLTKEQEDYLARVDAAQERLTGGQEDATLALGYQALAYAENVKLGDQLNDTLGGTNEAVSGLSASVDRLTLALTLLGSTDAEPTVAIAGLAEANSELGTVLARMNALDGSVASATVNVGANISPAAQDAINRIGFRDGGIVPFRDGGVVPYDHARDGIVGRGRLTRVGEAGPEDVILPAGSYVRNAAATAAARGSGSVVLTVNVGEVNGFAGVEAFAGELHRAVSARFASMGL